MPDSKQILIVDDSEDNVAYVSEILEANGYPYRVANNGEEAMAAIREARPDLVLLDIMMPRKSGVAVFHEMKKDPQLEKIPIVIITGVSEATGVQVKTGEEKPKESYTDDFQRRFGVDLHETLKDITPDGFLEKPVDPPALIKKIEELLS